ncbi:hypothetical protein K501DRAFT_270184 [Backusella circina FSU 941]|nr:hypothetical protein K501DRAFT_270184 [Backusella circina FSU 941]
MNNDKHTSLFLVKAEPFISKYVNLQILSDLINIPARLLDIPNFSQKLVQLANTIHLENYAAQLDNAEGSSGTDNNDGATILSEVFYRIQDVSFSVFSPEFYNNKNIVLYYLPVATSVSLKEKYTTKKFKLPKTDSRGMKEISHIKTLRRDTLMENTTVPFRVALGIVCIIDKKKISVGFVEFAICFATSKTKNDRVQLIMESKECLDTIYRAIHIYIPDIVIYSLQIADHKVTLSQPPYTEMVFALRTINNDICDDKMHLIRSVIKLKEQCLNAYEVPEKEFTIKNHKRLSFKGTLNKEKSEKYRHIPLPLPLEPIPFSLENNYEDE